jgi:Surface-adhesin protein E
MKEVCLIKTLFLIVFVSSLACASRPVEENHIEIVKSAKADEKSYGIWYFVTKVEKDSKFRVYVAKESISIENDERRSWSKLLFDQDQTDEDGTKYKEVFIYSTVNCANRTYSYKSARFYNALGELVSSENISQAPAPIIPDTVSDHVARFVCAYSKDE